MEVAVIFVLGIGNFAVHFAVLGSGHPLLDQLPGARRCKGLRLTLVFEFLILLAAMLLAANGWPGVLWAYLPYSALNGLTAWMILSGRV